MSDFATECHEGVTRQGEFQPCEKLAVALRYDVVHDGRPYPVCAYHTRGSDMVPLSELLKLAAEVAALATQARADQARADIDATLAESQKVREDYLAAHPEHRSGGVA